jgi:hypothetical protein
MHLRGGVFPCPRIFAAEASKNQERVRRLGGLFRLDRCSARIQDAERTNLTHFGPNECRL